MASYKIISSGTAVPPFTLLSTITNVGGDNAFDSDTPAGDSLTVNAGAFLIAQGLSANGALLANTGAWTVTINGTVLGTQFSGLDLSLGNTKASTITVGADGHVGGDTGMKIASAATIKNAGTIRGEASDGIRITGGSTHTITNSGTIAGVTFAIFDLGGSSNDKVTNSGTLTGEVALGPGTNSLTNSGSISGGYSGGSGNDTIVNSGSIGSFILVGGGLNKLTNSGTIAADATGLSFTGSGSVINSGTIAGGLLLEGSLTNSGSIGTLTNGISIDAGEGADTITNSKLISGDVKLDNGDNKLTNSGTIGGDVLGGDGVDIVINTGEITGAVSLGFGNDVYTGGSGIDVVDDSRDSDTIKLGGGNDVYKAAIAAGDGTDSIDGGKGIDTYDASGSANSVSINIDTIQHDDSPFTPGGNVIAAKTATGSGVAGTLKDTVTGFENVIGSKESDIIHGSGAANVLEGRDGVDTIYGYGGNDTLDGGNGVDSFVGGAGKDRLTGGAGGDFFAFIALTDSGITAATRDVITDFAGDGFLGDLINLSVIDANTKIADNQEFNFIGTNEVFTGAAGELRAYWTSTGQIIEGDVNGDRKADFSIEILDATHSITLSTENGIDFIL